MKTALVVLAAGLASRYGGNKQVDGIGPHGEILMEYSIHDAIAAGFNRVVFIIKPGMEALMRRLCGDYLERKTALDGSPVEVRYVFQDYGSLPQWFTPPEGRTKPYGTVHALLCAAEAVDCPCCVINADDYYGPGAYRTIHQKLLTLPESGAALMVGYLLKNTASLYGTVCRGICSVESGRLCRVMETPEIQMFPDGTLRDMQADRLLDPEALVSMNFWGFAPSIFPLLQDYFAAFLRERGQELKGECLLPVMADELIRRGALRVEMLHSEDRWFGMTYQEDRPKVAQELSRLHAEGKYPESLRE